jgi:D-ribose pyranose/furanose isomerase RbsD
MRRGLILNAELNRAIGEMVRGDLRIVCDAGLPILLEVWIVDRTVIQDVPDLKTVPSEMNNEFGVEKWPGPPKRVRTA